MLKLPPRSRLRLAAGTASSLMLLGSLALAGLLAAIFALLLARSVSGTLALASRDIGRKERRPS
jgi:hypothetical protein